MFSPNVFKHFHIKYVPNNSIERTVSWQIFPHNVHALSFDTYLYIFTTDKNSFTTHLSMSVLDEVETLIDSSVPVLKFARRFEDEVKLYMCECEICKWGLMMHVPWGYALKWTFGACLVWLKRWTSPISIAILIVLIMVSCRGDSFSNKSITLPCADSRNTSNGTKWRKITWGPFIRLWLN